VYPNSTAAFTIGSTPTVTELTSASAFAPQTIVAPYDLISLFGYDFCPTCSTSYVMLGGPNANMVYPITLSDGQANPKSLTVAFQQNAGNSSPLATTAAPLLFGTNNQINLLVPGVLAGYTGAVDIVVTFGGVSSLPYTVTVNPTDPGIFTVGSDGAGNGAILSHSYTIVNQTNPAAVRQASGGGANLSDNIQIYVSGLGAPWTGVANNATAASAATVPATPSTGHWSGDCIGVSNYLTVLNAATSAGLTSIDGAVVQSSLLDSRRLPPCLGNNGTTPTVGVKIGNVTAPISYAGWVADSIEGLYQINVQLPPSTSSFKTDLNSSNTAAVTAAVQLPVVVTANAVSSQPGVTVWVVPQLTVTAPTSVIGPIGAAWPTDSTAMVTATGGQSTYRYALTSGVLPLGLKFNSDGSISGTPALFTSGYYELTVTATDSATIPVTGTVSFQIQVTGGLVMTSSNQGPFQAVSGVLSANLTQITPQGGAPGGYTFTLTSSANSSAVTGLQIDTNGIVSSQTTTKAGVYNMIANALDTTAPTPLAGNYNFTVNVALNLPVPTLTAQPAGQSSAVLATVHATGGTGTIVYSLDTASANAGFAINGSTGAITVGTAAPLATWPMVVTATETVSKAAGASGYASATQTFNVTTLAPQAISFGTLSNVVYGSGTFTVSATASSGLTVLFTSTTSSVCTVATATVTILSGGTCTIQATQAGNSIYAPATPINQGFTVTPEAQTITFAQPADQVMSSVTYTLVGSASSGLTVSYASSTTGVCTVSGTTVTLVSDGTCTITATQAGNGNFAAATPVSQSFNVSGE
jgi:uncharacterized protein (TIGR03437 family)